MNLPSHLTVDNAAFARPQRARDPVVLRADGPSPSLDCLTFYVPPASLYGKGIGSDTRDTGGGDRGGDGDDGGGGGGGTPQRNEEKWRHSLLQTAIFSLALILAAAVGSYFPHANASREIGYPRVLRREQQQDAAVACGGGGVGRAEYDLPFHVGALFIIFIVSGSACVFPLLAIRFPKLRVPATFLFIVQHFGTGVLLATAFVHLLPTAFISLLDPCLGPFWSDAYPAMPGAIALASIFMVSIVEMVFSPGRHLCKGPRTALAATHTHGTHEEPALSSPANPGRPLQTRHTVGGRSSSVGRQLTRAGLASPQLDVAENGLAVETEEDKNADIDVSDHSSPAGAMTPEQQKNKAVVQCTLLEIGILFHSIFIGMSLSVAVGNDFTVLLIAIVFHQSCEGLALGARIAQIQWSSRAIQPWMMALAYGCTTPLGQAIGLATHRLYDPASEVGLLIVGIFNAISAGVLIFNSLIELLSEDFLSDESWRLLRGKKRIAAFTLVLLGAFAMSLIGAWA